MLTTIMTFLSLFLAVAGTYVFATALFGKKHSSTELNWSAVKEDSLARGCGVAVVWLFVIIGYLPLIGLMLTLELILILYALANGLGVPVLAYAALAAWIISVIRGAVKLPDVLGQFSKISGELIETGKTKLEHTSSDLAALVGWLPDLYAGYLFLVLINVL